MFPAELRTMAIVPRWNIVMTSLRDNVATHTFFVTTYAYMVGKIIGWRGPYDYLMLAALMHDNDETITSDITGPVKSMVIDSEAQDHLDSWSEDRMGALMDMFYDLENSVAPGLVEEAHLIVKAADKLDALLFLIVNKRMGNTCVEPAIIGNQRGLEGAWKSLPADEMVIDATWNTVVLPSIKEHYERGGRGFAPGVSL